MPAQMFGFPDGEKRFMQVHKHEIYASGLKQPFLMHGTFRASAASLVGFADRRQLFA